MRMTFFLIIVILIAAVAGCMVMNPRLGPPPRLGEFSYVHVPPYVGHPVREIPIWMDVNFGEADKVEIDKAVAA